jgi:hypothetical protein
LPALPIVFINRILHIKKIIFCGELFNASQNSVKVNFFSNEIIGFSLSVVQLATGTINCKGDFILNATTLCRFIENIERNHRINTRSLPTRQRTRLGRFAILIISDHFRG